MNDELLVCYFFGDGLTESESRRVARRIAEDPAVARRYRDLCAGLEALADDTPAPPADMVHRWHEALDRHADAAAASRPRWHAGSFLWGAVVTAALAVGVGIGLYLGGIPNEASPVPGAASVAGSPQAAFMRAVEVYLRDSGRELEALPVTSSQDRAALVGRIIDQNRRYERAAELNRADDLARVLRAFELVLDRLADQDLTPQEAAALRRRLMFELNAVLTKLDSGTSNDTDSI